MCSAPRRPTTGQHLATLTPAAAQSHVSSQIIGAVAHLAATPARSRVPPRCSSAETMPMAPPEVRARQSGSWCGTDHRALTATFGFFFAELRASKCSDRAVTKKQQKRCLCARAIPPKIPANREGLSQGRQRGCGTTTGSSACHCIAIDVLGCGVAVEALRLKHQAAREL